MLCGPNLDNNESLIEIWEGFSPHFTPPSMVAQKPAICRLNQPIVQPFEVGNHPLQGRNADQRYIGLLDNLKENIEGKYLNLAPNPVAQGNNAGDANSSTVISTANFDTHWEQKVFKQVEDILKFWVVKYDDVSAELLNSINTNPQNWVNNIAIRQGGIMPGPFSTRIKEAASQELRLYVMLLGEIQKDLMRISPAAEREPQSGHGGTSSPRGTPTQPLQPPLISYRTSESRHLSPTGWRSLMQPKYGPDRVGAPLFWHLREQDPLDFATIAVGFETTANQQRLSRRTGNLEFQNEALATFKDVTDLFLKFEVTNLDRNNPNSCWAFFNQSYMCRQWNALKDRLGFRNERMHEVKANVTREEEDTKLKAFDDKMKQIETDLISQLNAESRAVRLSNEQKLFIEDLVKRSKSLGESMKHMLSMLRMNEIAAQINGLNAGRERIQGPAGGSIARPR